MINFIFNRRILSHLKISFRFSPNVAFLSSSSSSSSSSLSLSSPNSVIQSSKKDSITVNYGLNSCGFVPKSDFSASNLINIKTRVEPGLVIVFLKNFGFTDPQISLVVRRFPVILFYDPEKSLLPKFDFFGSVGFSRTDLVKIVTSRPIILRRSLKNHLVPTFRYFEDLLQSDEKALSVIKRWPSLLESDLQAYFIPNIQFLQQIGVPKLNIVQLLVRGPRAFISSADKFRRNVDRVKELGFDPSQVKFLVAVRAFVQMSDSTWEKKVKLFKKWGWSEDEFFEAFRKFPLSFMMSAEKIDGVMEFFVNKMGLESSIVAFRPLLLTLSLKRRIIPRSLVYQVLLDRGLIEKHSDSALCGWLQPTDSEFICRIHKSYEKEAPELLKLYQKSLELAT